MSLPKTHVDRKSEEIKIKGDKFLYLTMLPGDLLEWLPRYTEVDPETAEVKQDLFKMTQCKLDNLVDAPYTPDQIHAILGKVFIWKDLTIEQKWEILKHYKYIDKLINKMNEIDSPKGAEKKSSLKKSEPAISSTDSKLKTQES